MLGNAWDTKLILSKINQLTETWAILWKKQKMFVKISVKMVVTVEISETIKGSSTKYSKKFIPV